MTTTTTATIPPTPDVRAERRLPATRSARHDLGTVGAMLTSDWIKLRSLRSNWAMLALAVAVSASTSWAVARFVTDEVLTVSEVFVYPTALTSVLASVAAILLVTSEVQHGTLATALAARPARWVIVTSKAIIAAVFGLVFGAAGLLAGFAGSSIGRLELGDTSVIASTAMWALMYTTLSGIIGLGVGLIVRHSAAAISGFLVWWFVIENLLAAFAPVNLSRLLPFVTGYRMLGVPSDFDSTEAVAAALTRGQNAFAFIVYTLVTLTVGTVVLYRRDTD
jgi:ABC-2 type transport system permease protein